MSQDLSSSSSAEGEPSDSGEQPPGLESDREPVAADDLFRVLSSATNRFALYYLIKVGRPASVNELVEYVVTSTGPPADDKTTGESRGEVRTSIESVLPELDSLGLLKYHAQSDFVEPTEKTQVAEPYLALALEQLA